MSDDEEDIKTNFDFKKFISMLDLRDCVIILLIALMWLMVTIATNDITACNNYWLNKTAEKTPEMIANLTESFIYLS